MFLDIPGFWELVPRLSALHLENVLPLPGLALDLGAILLPRLHWSSLLKTPTLKKGF